MPDGIALHNADCFEVFKGIEANSIDLIFTDPPYGHNNNNGDLIDRREEALGKEKKDKPRPILNDGPEANELVRKLFREAARILKPGCCCCCCCCGGGPDPQFARWSLWIDEFLDFKQMVVWDKGPMGMGWHYRRSYETILVAQKRGAACHWFDDSHKIENIIRPGDYGIKKIIPTKKQHPTTKPVALMTHFIRLHSMPGDVVMDPFMGGGTTGVACVNMDRQFIGVELAPEFYEMAEKRIENAVRNRQHSLELV